MELFSHKTVRRLFAVVLALGMISAAFVGALGGAFGPEVQDAAEEIAPVGTADALIGTAAAIGVGIAVGIWLDHQGVSKEKVKKIKSSEDAQQKADLAAALAGRRDSTERFVAEMENFIADSRLIASMKAKTRIVEMLNNGTTDAAVIENAVDDVIADYYAVRQRNLLAQYKSHMAQVAYAINTVQNDSGIATDWMRPNQYVLDGFEFRSFENLKNTHEWATDTTTLVNGSQVTVPYLHIRMYDSDQAKYISPRIGLLWGNRVKGGRTLDGAVHQKVTHSSLSTNYSRAYAINVSVYAQTYEAINQTTSQMQANYDQSFITNVAGAYERGAINTSDLVTPEMLASEWATEYNQTGASTYKWATLAALGLDSPDLQNVSHLNLTYLKNVGHRHVTLNFSGSPTATNYTVSWLDPVAGLGSTTLSLSGSVDTSIRVPAHRNAIITVKTTSANVSWDTRPDSVTPYAVAGESKTIGGLTVTVESPSPRDWRTEKGMLFARTAPAGGFDVGTTYSVSNLSTSVYFTPAGQNTTIQKVIGNFTINAAQGDNGQQLQVVKTEDYNYQTTNASQIEEQLTQLSTLRQQVEAREPIVGSGGGGLFGGLGGLGSIGVPIGLLALAGAALLILSRS